MFACIIAILAQIQIALPSLVPITLQTLGIYLAAMILKPKLAFTSSLIYILMGAIGLPVFAGFSGGIGIILGPTGGYIYSFPIIALIISFLNKNNYLSTKLLALVIATSVCYGIGTLWFMYISQSSLLSALSLCVIPFIPGDIIKIVAAIILSNKIKLKF